MGTNASQSSSFFAAARATREANSMTETATTTPEEQLLTDINKAAELFPALTLQDRCDHCGAAAQAQVQVHNDLPNLLLCGHHFRNNRAAFEASGYLFAAPATDAEQFTWAKHQEPWPNPFRDAASAV
jgi:hypothetical protein